MTPLAALEPKPRGLGLQGSAMTPPLPTARPLIGAHSAKFQR
jgi:hypothetical protein